MARLIWDDVGKRYFETGIRQGVLYVQNNDGTYRTGVAWNGLINVTERSTGGEATPVYANDKKYLNLYSKEELEATIEAYNAPDEFNQCFGVVEIADGAKIIQQSRRSFGFCYRTAYGNDITGIEFGHKIHILYGCKASAQSRVYKIINDSPEPVSFTWELTTLPIKTGHHKPVSQVVIDSRLCDPDALQMVENILYGSRNNDPRLLTPAEIQELIEHSAYGVLINEDEDYIVFGGYRIIIKTV